MNAPRTVVSLILMLLVVPAVSAQEQDRTPDVLKTVLLDPTTYAPAVVAWEASRLDWRSSQVFFQNGWTEHNARFTVSGSGDTTAIGYAAGNRQILTDALSNLQYSVVNNVSSRMMERLLIPRYPTHRRLLRSVGWIERSAMASYLAYRLSAQHFRQWQDNEWRAQQLGY